MQAGRTQVTPQRRCLLEAWRVLLRFQAPIPETPLSHGLTGFAAIESVANSRWFVAGWVAAGGAFAFAGFGF